MKAYLLSEDIYRMETMAINLRDKLLIRVLFYAGCRVSEALAIKVEDIDLRQGIIIINHLKERIKWDPEFLFPPLFRVLRTMGRLGGGVCE